MSTKIQKIDYAIFHNPDLIPILIKDCSINNGLIYSRLRRAIPRRVGIEFECVGNPAKYYNNLVRKISHKKDLGNIFNLLEYDQDEPITSRDISTNYVSSDFIMNEESDETQFNELRVSIKDYTQLLGLYKILDLFKNSCTIPIGGGIHIHIDFKDYDFYHTQLLVSKYITNHLEEVENIFPKYLGSYNAREVGLHRKGTYVNLSYHGSIEFRIAPLTFDYETLIKWIVDCNKFVTKLIHECHLIAGKDMGSFKESNPNEGYLNSINVREIVTQINNLSSQFDYYIAEDDYGCYHVQGITR